VVEKTGHSLIVQLEASHAQHTKTILQPGDGVVFDEGHPEQDEQGGRITRVRDLPSHRLELTLFRGSINLAAIALGSIVWKTDDPAMRRRMEQSYSRDVVVHREPIDFQLTGVLDGPLSIECHDANGNTGRATWPGPLEVAKKHPWTIELIREQL